MDSNAGFAEFGSVFSSTQYQRDVVGTHNPKALVVSLKKDGLPVVGCEVLWETAAGHGWVFPTTPQTNSSGQVRAFWTAGDQGSQTARARARLDGGAEQTVSFTGTATPSPRTRTDSVHIQYQVPGTYTELKVQVTPVTGPQSTYYSTVNWPGAYGGIQFDDFGGPYSMVLFSVWDVDATHKSEFKSTGACNVVAGFGGEGTGTSCRLQLPPSRFGAIAGLPNDYTLRPGDTYETHVIVAAPADCATCLDYTFMFTDVTRSIGPISLGTQRYKQRANVNYATGFIEDWNDAPGDHCLNSGVRTAYFHNIQALTSGAWRPVTAATFNRVYLPANHEICSNYYFGLKDGKFLMSSGGTQLISRPVVQGDAEFGISPQASQ